MLGDWWRAEGFGRANALSEDDARRVLGQIALIEYDQRAFESV